MTHVSAIVCTLNRADDLRDALTALVAQTYPPEAFEIIVVDNGSTDETPRVVAKLATGSAAPVRYVFEPTQGLSQARNAGARAAAGEMIAYTDDDAIPHPDWLASLAQAFTQYDDLGAAGGPIDPLWLPRRPDWFPPQCVELLGAMDRGPRFRWITFPECPWGPNIAVRKEAHRRAGGFHTGFGLVGSHLALHEEPDLCARIENLGYRLAYLPSAKVQHKMRSDKVNRHYLRRWCWAQGTGHVGLYLRANHWSASDLPLQGLYALKRALELWRRSRLLAHDNSHEALAAEWETYSLAGLSAESLRQMAPNSGIVATLEAVPDIIASLSEERARDYPNVLLSILLDGYRAAIPDLYATTGESTKAYQEIKALWDPLSRHINVAATSGAVTEPLMWYRTARSELRKGHITRAASAMMRAIRYSPVGAVGRKAARSIRSRR